MVCFFFNKWKKSNHAGLLALLILLVEIVLAQGKLKDKKIKPERVGVSGLASGKGKGEGCGCLRTVVMLIECLNKVIISPSFHTSNSPY